MYKMISLLYKNSTIQWCEDKYVYSNYIMEWYNTLTGIFLSLSGILFYINNRHSVYISKFNNVSIILIVLGIGTMLFHSTLLYIFQLTDEIPMLLLCVQYIKFINNFVKYYNLNENDDIVKLTELFIKNIYIYSFLIGIIGFIYNWLQVLLFQLSIIMCVGYLLTQFYYIEKHNIFLFKKLLIKKNKLEQDILYHYTVNVKLTLLRNNIKYIQYRQDNLKKYKNYFYLSAFLSVIVWLIDNCFCNQIKYYNMYFNGHALWHIFTSFGLYYSNMMMITQFKIIFWYKNFLRKEL